MKKEELIDLMNNLKISEISSFNINYYDKEKEIYGIPKERELRTISYREDMNKGFENIKREIDMIDSNINRRIYQIVDEKINEVK